MRLHPVTTRESDELHALFCLEPVYRYLADGAPPPRAITTAWIAASERDLPRCGLGLWLLRDAAGVLAGCLRLDPDTDQRSAEVTWVLHPDRWGAGLATRMGWTAIERTFAGDAFGRVVAGADAPNARSIAVMRRLGMTFWRDAAYAAGPGVEYVFRRGDAAPEPVPEPIPFD
jgi:ribosomal-protein-alanine N-acetyltransferase